jgi:hypothetical protein
MRECTFVTADYEMGRCCSGLISALITLLIPAFGTYQPDSEHIVAELATIQDVIPLEGSGNTRRAPL